MKFLKSFVGIAVVLIGAVLILAYTFGQVVPPGFVGVRQIAFGPNQGYSGRGLEPAYHWNIPFFRYSRIYVLPETLQILEFNRENPPPRSALEVQTTDGSSVQADISFIYRIEIERTKEHGGPSDLINSIGLAPESWLSYLGAVVPDEVRKSLGKLSTSDFYNPELREIGVQEALNGINARLGPVGLRGEALLIRRYTYVEPRIDNAIFEKNLQNILSRVNVAKSRRNEAEAAVHKTEAEWDAKIKTLRVGAENRVRVLHSEGELYETQKKAEGDLLVAKGIAEVERLRAGALAGSEGADMYVGKQLAPLLGSIRGGVITGIDPYNLSEWISRFGLKEKE